MARIIGLFALLLFCSQLLMAEGNNLFRYPAINNDGTKLVFCYQGDIWTVSAEGGFASRLTIHEGNDAIPRFSYDGKTIAFNSDRYGNDDIFTMPVDGGAPNRLTFNSSNDLISDYSKDDEILFITARNFKQVEWTNEIYSINQDNATPNRVMDAFGTMPVKSPNSRFIAYVDGVCPTARYAYRGSSNREIFIYDTKTNKYTQFTKFDGNDYLPRWSGDGEIYYLSAQKGVYNIFKQKVSVDGNSASEPIQLTDFNDDGIRYFDISSDGKTIVFERGSEICIMPSSGGKNKKVEIQISSDYRFDPVEYKTLTNGITDYSVSPNGKYTAFVIRGEVFISENAKDKKKVANLSDSPFRDKDVTWLSDTTLIFASDRNGQQDLFLVKSADSKKANLIKTLKYELVRLTKTDENESSPSVSPDCKKIVFVRGQGELVVCDISAEGKMTNEKILNKSWTEPYNIKWSPDSKWLAYVQANLEFNEEIYLQPADNSAKPFNLTVHPREDNSPVWSKDGSKLGFISYRNNGNGDVWFVWLKKADWEKTKQDWEDSEEDTPKKDTKKSKDKDSTKNESIVIDFDNIRDRFVQVTALPGNESDVQISKDGKTFYFVTNRNSNQTYKADQDLYSIKWDGTESKQLTSNGQKPYGVTLDPTGKSLFLLKQRGTLSKIDISNNKEEALPFAAVMKIDYAVERKQIFEEAWRVTNETFYDPNFHGMDWDKLKKKYEPLALMSSTDGDFRDIINLMFGELNASHMGIYGGDRAETQKERTGLLGVEIEPLKEGVKIKEVIPESPADKTESKLNVGDIIVSVNQTPVSENVNFYSLFTNTVNDQVLLEVKNGKGEIREVVIRPTGSLRNLQYNAWVNSRRKLVDKYSNGKLGYIHIQGMDWPSFERFESELTASCEGKEGLLIDVRYNGGGWTTDYLLTVLNVKQHAYTIPRGAANSLEKDKLKFRDVYAYSERLPFPAWTKPSITLCNSFSYSNAEIFSHAYQSLGLGKLVGTPTFGAVISTGAYTLIDGSYIRTPGRGWFVKKTDKNMENNAAVPDYIVENPQDYRTSEDLQLKKAVDELLKEVK